MSNEEAHPQNCSRDLVASFRNGAESIAMCFSGGKDSVMALHEIRCGGKYVVRELLTTVTVPYDRVTMHGVRRALAQRQAGAIGIPLTEVAVPPSSSNAVYEREMGRAFDRLRAEGLRRVAFGDIFLEDLRIYREEQLASRGLECLFPIWRRDAASLAHRFIADGFRAVVVCVNLAALDVSFVGRPFDEAFLADLPAEVDPCGEHGEFHTFVFDGPIFRWPVSVSTGEIVERDCFAFCDLVAEDEGV